MMQRQAFVLDTNVLLFDPQAIYKFSNNDIIIPIVVIEEIDRFKRDMSENGRHARMISRVLDELRSLGELAKGVELPNGSVLSVELGLGSVALPSELSLEKADNRILANCLAIQQRRKVIFITKDVNLRLKADALGIQAQDYDQTSVEPDQLYSGVLNITVEARDIEEFYDRKKLNLRDVTFKPNQYVVLTNQDSSSHMAMARYSKEKECLVPITKPYEGLWGVFPKNAEQAFAIDALLNDEIKLVSLVGKAGTGKTLLAIAAGLSKTVDESVYHRLLVSRPVFPMGKDIGFLPGSVEEKLNPWMQPIYDNVDFLFGTTGHRGGGEKRGMGRNGQELMNQGLLQIEPLTYIRGRSIPQQYLIVDESQNLTPHEIKTIITRAGEGTKIVLTGDPYQIDNPYVDSANNGLVHLVERFKDESIAAHITMTKGERSLLSELATNLL